MDNLRTIAKSYTIDSANTWEKKTITFDGDTTGTLDNDNAGSLYLELWLGAGSTYTSGTLATSWESNTAANVAVGQVNLADSTSNELYITGCQLEVGSKATDFEFEPYDRVLSRCQRYFEKVSTEYNADYTPFYLSYTDELAKNYQLDQMMFKFINFVAILAIIIGSLGLYSLLSFIVQQRTKELGIRKVIGANTGGLMMLLSKKFILFILIATVLAAPLGYIGAEFWLERFAYRTEIGLMVFVLAFIITGFITLGSISYRTFKAATLNPIKSLRYE